MIGGPKTQIQNEKQPLRISINESALAFAILNDNENSLIEYNIDNNGNRILNSIKSEDERKRLVIMFKNDPKDVIAKARNAISNILKDKRMNDAERKSRVERYVDAFLELNLKLDKLAFPKRGVEEGVPEYIPDGFIDMGSDMDDTSKRNSGREMIHVDKRKIFKQFRDFLVKMYLYGYDDYSSTESKRSIVEEIGKIIYKNMPYNRTGDPFGNLSGLVDLSETYMSGLSVCRHHALYAQILMQFCGLKSLLFKCDVDLGRGLEPHVANLVRINGKWFLVDFTNPDIEDDKTNKGVVFIKEVNLPKEGPESKQAYSWKFYVNRFKRENTYNIRRNMFSKVI